MNGRAAILVVSCVLFFSAQLVSSRLYAIETDWVNPGCNATPGNAFIDSEARPVDFCFDSQRVECNATHIIEYSCEDACNCTTFEAEIELGCFPRGQGSRQFQCIDTDPVTFANSLRTNRTLAGGVYVANYDTQCTPASLTTVYFSLETYRCRGLAKKRDSADLLYYNYGYNTCNSTGQFFYGCNDSLCEDCTTAPRFDEWLVCQSETNYFYNETCLALDAIGAPALPPVASPAAAPVAAPISGGGNAPSQGGNAPTGSGGALTATNAPSGSTAPTAPKAPSTSAPKSASPFLAPSLPLVIVAFFGALWSLCTFA